MNNYFKVFVLLVLIPVSQLFSGCTTSMPEQTRTLVGDYQPPDWVNKGGGAFKDAKEKVFYGVGLADGMNNLSLQRTTADNRALANIANQIKTVVKGFTKDFERFAKKNASTTEEEIVEKGLKLVLNQTVEGARIIDHWEHPGKNVLYALARVELSKLQKQINTIDRKVLSDEAKEAINKKADKLFDEMGKEGL